jgi:4-hydroxybenzoate polyprenyltransferase
LLWCALVVGALGLLLALGSAVAAPWTVGILGTAGAALCLSSGSLFLRRMDPSSQQCLDQMSALWLLICYGAAGFAPLAWRL